MDAKTGQFLPNAIFDVTIIETLPTERRSTGNEIGSSFEQVGIYEQIEMPSPSGFIDGKPAMIFEITPKIAPAGYQLNRNSGSIYATENGWNQTVLSRRSDRLSSSSSSHRSKILPRITAPVPKTTPFSTTKI